LTTAPNAALSTVTEFELKFQIDPAQRAGVEAAVARGHSYRTRLRARYFDTADGALAAERIVLRLRKEGGQWVQTAKAPTDDPLQRHEHNFELPAMGAREVPLPSIPRHEGTPVGDLIAKALEKAGHEPTTVELITLYATEVWRTTREMRTGDAMVELAFDRGEVRAGAHTHALCELEIELKHGSPQSMLELAQRWRNRYGLWLDTVSKSARGERLAKGIEHGSPTKAKNPMLDGELTGPQIFRLVLNACLAQILPNASEVASGSTDAEHVHQLRVGIRRLRTALREMAELAPGIDPAWEAALVDTFRALGLGRDREHLLQTVQPRIEGVGGPPVAWPASSADVPEPAEVVRGAAFQTVLISLIASSLPVEGMEKGVPARKALRKRLSDLHRKVLRDGRRFEALEPTAQHRVRKRLKRLRYLGEFVAPLFGQRAATRYLEGLEPAQDALGKHNDDAVAIATYRDAAAHDGRAWFAVGWLSARQPADAVECRKALDKVADARPFWKKR
jgi:triphosphatase